MRTNSAKWRRAVAIGSGLGWGLMMLGQLANPDGLLKAEIKIYHLGAPANPSMLSIETEPSRTGRISVRRHVAPPTTD